MADYTKTNWVENVTKVGPTNMNKLEEGVRLAGKRANMLGSTTDLGVDWQDDRYGTQWVRQSDGSFLRSQHTYEAASEVTALDRTLGVNTAGKAVTHEIGAIHEGIVASTLQKFGARLKLIATWGGRRQARLNMNTEAGGTNSGPDKLLLDDLGASDWIQNPTGFADLTGSSAWNAPRQPNLTHATLVHMSLTAVAGTQASVYVGPANPPTQRILIGGGGGQTAAWLPFTFIVPPGYYYRYTQDVGAPNIGTRIEWTL